MDQYIIQLQRSHCVYILNVVNRNKVNVLKAM